MKLSVIVIVYNIRREAPRTLLSLSHGQQKGIKAGDYEVIVVENGSSEPLDAAQVASYGSSFHYHYLKDASPSPAAALNFGIKQARGEVIGIMIDGARIVTPGILHYALAGSRLYPRAITATMGFYLGEGYQRHAIMKGYNQEVEDRLLESIEWPKDGYRLFEIGSRDESSPWFSHLAESNALFMHRDMWAELGGIDERFNLPGGGLVNLDTFDRACALPSSQLVVLMGEATFHQVHGGIATNARPELHEENLKRWAEQYRQIHGKDLSWPTKPRKWLGHLPNSALAHLAWEAKVEIDEHFHHQRGELYEQARVLREHNAQLSAQLDQVRGERDRLQRELDLVHWSTSWKLMAPLRTVYRRFSGLRERLTRLRPAAQNARNPQHDLQALHAANRLAANPAVERKLLQMRAEAFKRSNGIAHHPPVELPPEGTAFGLPVAQASELDPRRVREAILSYGALHVRGLLDGARVEHLRSVIDSALAAQEAAFTGTPLEQTTPWFDPSRLIANAEVTREFVRSTGAVLAVDSPRGMYQLIETLYQLGLDRLVTDFFGERPALSAEKTTLRRVVAAPEPAGWHQDGRFLGSHIRSLNIWIALSDCGTHAPGLELVPKRLGHIVPTGTPGSDYDWSVSEETVASEFAGTSIRPQFKAGDALLFDHFLLHRTARDMSMTQPRYAIESWFFAPSAYPESQTGLYV